METANSQVTFGVYARTTSLSRLEARLRTVRLSTVYPTYNLHARSRRISPPGTTRRGAARALPPLWAGEVGKAGRRRALKFARAPRQSGRRQSGRPEGRECTPVRHVDEPNFISVVEKHVHHVEGQLELEGAASSAPGRASVPPPLAAPHSAPSAVQMRSCSRLRRASRAEAQRTPAAALTG